MHELSRVEKMKLRREQNKKDREIIRKTTEKINKRYAEDLIEYYDENGTFLEFIEFDHKDVWSKTFNLYECKICGKETIKRADRVPKTCGCINLANSGRKNVAKRVLEYVKGITVIIDAPNRDTINIYNKARHIENGIDLHDLPGDKCEVKEKKEDEKI